MRFFAVVAMFSTLFLSSCSNDQNKKEKGVIDKHNEKVAQEAIQMIKTPLDQAKMAAEQTNAHNQQAEDQLKTQ